MSTPPHSSLEPFKLKNRSLSVVPALWAFSARLVSRAISAPAGRLLLVLVTASAALGLSSCTHNVYQFPEYTFAGRPIPPSQLGERVLVGVTNGGSGALVILDGLRDIRNNISNTVQGFTISGYSGGYPSNIISFPEQLRGYVYSNASPYPLGIVNYSTESSSGNAASFGTPANSVATAPDFVRIYGAVEESGQVLVVDNTTGASYALNLPNVYKVAVNTGDTVALAM